MITLSDTRATPTTRDLSHLVACLPLVAPRPLPLDHRLVPGVAKLRPPGGAPSVAWLPHPDALVTLCAPPPYPPDTPESIDARREPFMSPPRSLRGDVAVWVGLRAGGDPPMSAGGDPGANDAWSGGDTGVSRPCGAGDRASERGDEGEGTAGAAGGRGRDTKPVEPRLALRRIVTILDVRTDTSGDASPLSRTNRVATTCECGHEHTRRGHKSTRERTRK